MLIFKSSSVKNAMETWQVWKTSHTFFFDVAYTVCPRYDEKKIFLTVFCGKC